MGPSPLDPNKSNYSILSLYVCVCVIIGKERNWKTKSKLAYTGH